MQWYVKLYDIDIIICNSCQSVTQKKIIINVLIWQFWKWPCVYIFNNLSYIVLFCLPWIAPTLCIYVRIHQGSREHLSYRLDVSISKMNKKQGISIGCWYVKSLITTIVHYLIWSLYGTQLRSWEHSLRSLQLRNLSTEVEIPKLGPKVCSRGPEVMAAYSYYSCNYLLCTSLKYRYWTELAYITYWQ